MQKTSLISAWLYNRWLDGGTGSVLHPSCAKIDYCLRDVYSGVSVNVCVSVFCHPPPALWMSSLDGSNRNWMQQARAWAWGLGVLKENL